MKETIMPGTSWVVHAGSQHKSKGQSNTSFDLDLNQSLEFNDSARCHLTNICIPNVFPNVSDSFGNRTWSFTFRYYNITPTRDASATTATKPYHSYTALAWTTMLKEYTMTVSIPEGFYDVPYETAAGTETDNIPEFAKSPFALDHLSSQDAGFTSRDIDTQPFTKLRSEFMQTMTRHPIATLERSRTYVEALQKAIWQEQQRIRNNVLYGYGGAAPAAGSADEASRVIETLISELVIVPIVNKYHQLEFLIRANFSTGVEAIATATAANVTATATINAFGSDINNILANPRYFTILGVVNTVNPWGINASNFVMTPTHALQCKIVAPSSIRFTGRSVTNCLDFYNLSYNKLDAATVPAAGNQLVGGDIYAGTALPYIPTLQKTGNLTAYGNTWNTHSILKGRADGLRNFTINNFNNTEDGWFNCAIFGVGTKFSAGAPARIEQACHMYSTMYNTPLASYRLQLVTMVEQNRARKTQYSAFSTANIVSYPTGASAANCEGISDVFTGTSVRVSPNELLTPSTAYFSWDNLFAVYKNIIPMDVVDPVVINVEVDMFGVSNHFMFTGKQECKRMKLVKRLTGSATFGSMLKNNEESHGTMDYGTNVGMTKVSTIQVRVKDNLGNVISFSDPTAFPDWYFTLVFET